MGPAFLSWMCSGYTPDPEAQEETAAKEGDAAVCVLCLHSWLPWPDFDQQLRRSPKYESMSSLPKGLSLCVVKSFWCLAGVGQCREHTSSETVTAAQGSWGRWGGQPGGVQRDSVPSLTTSG